MREISAEELLRAAAEGNALAVYFHTPTCGTCRVARRMMEAVELLLPELLFLSCDLNLAPELAQNWQIRSVPCAVYIKNGQPVGFRYRMGDTVELYHYYQELLKSGADRED